MWPASPGHLSTEFSKSHAFLVYVLFVFNLPTSFSPGTLDSKASWIHTLVPHLDIKATPQFFISKIGMIIMGIIPCSRHLAENEHSIKLLSILRDQEKFPCFLSALS